MVYNELIIQFYISGFNLCPKHEVSFKATFPFYKIQLCAQVETECIGDTLLSIRLPICISAKMYIQIHIEIRDNVFCSWQYKCF
jgi:hypothetical protein